MLKQIRSRLRPKTRFRQLQQHSLQWKHQTRSQLRQWLLTRSPRLCLSAKTSECLTLFPKGAGLIKLASGFQFTEGPIWLPQQQCLLFSDIPANQIFQLTTPSIGQQPTHPTIHTFRNPSQHANGLTLDRQGRLVVCEHGTRQLTRTEIDGSITILASHFQGKRLNSPNDVVVKSDGTIYFTDPPYGIESSQQEQSHQGVYRIDPETGELSLVVADFAGPNGLVFSPDERRLYISDSHEARQHVRVFAVQLDGRLTGGEVFCNLNVDRPGVPDGMSCDRYGNLFCTGAGGIWIFSPHGNYLGIIRTPEIPTNCTWGKAHRLSKSSSKRDSDVSSLYITAGKSVYSIDCLSAPI